MKYLRIVNDKSKRLVFKKEELKKSAVFLLKYNLVKGRVLWWNSLDTRLSSKVKIKNYCILSGRARGVIRDFKLSRILLRKLGAKGFISGLKKKTW